MKQSTYLNSPATHADVIGWCLAVPLLVWVAVTAPTIYPLPAKFAELFAGFEFTPPMTTRIFLGMGGPGVVSLLGLLALVPVVVLLVGRRAWLKLASPLACGIAVVLLNHQLVRSLYEPIVQLMAQLAGQPK